MIITFYSYKGGVGRSMALANVAEWLFRQGLRVIVVDWDLEAPGIESYFETDPRTLQSLSEGRGIVDLLVNYESSHPTLLPTRGGTQTTGATPLSADEKLKVVSEQLPSVAFSLQPLEQSPRPSMDGKDPGIWLLSAGARGKRFAEYADHVHSFDWNEFYLKRDGAIFFRWLRAELEKFADVVLVDSRTGVTEMSGVCTRDLADLVVSFCAPNDSNLDGVIRMHRWFLDSELLGLRAGRPLRAMIVPCRIDGKSETEELGRFRRKFFERANALRDVDPQVNADAWWNLQIGYVSYYSFHEQVVIGRTGSEYLQKDLEKVATELARCYLAHAADARIDFTGRKLGRALEGMLAAGVAASVRAETALQRIPAEKQQRALATLARFVKLARADEGGAITAIRVPVSVFETLTPPLLEDLLQVGLVRRTDEDAGQARVELSDEAYAYQWKRLEQSVRSDSEFILWRQQFDAYLNAHRAHGGARSTLLTGEVLIEATHWESLRRDDLTQEEQDFIHASTQEPKAIPGPARTRFVAIAASIALALGTAWGVYGLVKDRTRLREASTVAALEREARSALQQDDYLVAIGKFDLALKLLPQGASLLFERGSAKATASRLPERAGLLAEAIDDLDNSLKIDPLQPEALRVRAEALQRRNAPGDLDSADADLTQAIALEPTNAYYPLARAKLRESRGLTEPALQDYTKALQIDPSSAEAHLARGLLFVSAKQTDQASLDFRQVVALGGEQALVDVANAQLQRLGQTQASASKPRVLIQFGYRPDRELVNLIIKDLSSEFAVSGPELTRLRIDGDVRYFFREDRSIATRLNTLLQSALATQGVRRQLAVIYVDPKASRLSSAERGKLEVRLPALTAISAPVNSDLATLNVDVFWCAGSDEPARYQAQTLLKNRQPKWQGRWQLRELSASDNARPGYRVSGYQVRVSSVAEAAVGEELRTWMEKTLDALVATVPAERSATPNYVSLFVCPDRASLK